MALIEKARAWLKARLTDDGLEKLDPTPVEIPLDYDRPQSLEERISRMMSQYHRQMQYLKNEEMETPEEADDFDIDDDPVDPVTPYEEHFMPRPDVNTDKLEIPEPEAASAGSAPADADAEPAPEPEPEPVPALAPTAKRSRKSAVST